MGKKTDHDGDLVIAGSLQVLGGFQNSSYSRTITRLASTEGNVEAVTGRVTDVEEDLVVVNEQLLVESVKLGMSTQSVTRARDGSLSPSSLTVTSKTTPGTDYPGRFVISLSADGSTFVDSYTSASDESSKAYTIPATVNISGTIYFVASVRVRLCKSGGTTDLIRESYCLVSLTSSVVPMYWGALTSAPAGSVIEGDYYFDSNVSASGGGVLRTWSGTAWFEYTSSMAGYTNAVMAALPDMADWSETQGDTVAAASAIFGKLFAYNAYLANIFANMIMLTGALTAYQGEGVNRRALRLSSSGLDWLNGDVGSEQLFARFGRLGVAGPVIIDGPVVVPNDGATWSHESTVYSGGDASLVAVIERSNGERRRAYTRNWTVYEEIKPAGGSWGTAVSLGFRAQAIAYGEVNGELRLAYRVNNAVPPSSGNLMEQVWSDGSSSWGTAALIALGGSVGLGKFTYVNDTDGSLLLVYATAAKTLVARTLNSGSWGSEVAVGSVTATSVASIIRSNGEMRVAYANGFGDLYEAVCERPAMTLTGIVSLTSYSGPSIDYSESIDGKLRIAYLEGASRNIVERILGSSWGAPAAISVTQSSFSAYLQLQSGDLVVTYSTYTINNLVERTLSRYQSLSYPQSGYVAGRGWWQKHADGTQECWFNTSEDTTGATITNFDIGTYGISYYRKSPITWTFPLEFISAPTCQPPGCSRQGWAEISGLTATELQYGILQASPGLTGVRLYAKGRWKA